jgi:acetyl-CoA C-acetyltransferase
VALVVGTESMTRNPIAAFTHRTGFKLGAPVEFKDFMWEALNDPACGHQHDPDGREPGQEIRHHPRRGRRLCLHSFAKAVAAQQSRLPRGRDRARGQREV